MPVQRKHLDARRLIRSDTTRQAEKQHDTQHYQTCGDVKGVQTNQRVVGRSKEIGRDGQPVFVNKPMPFLTSAKQKEAAQYKGEQPPREKSAALTAFKQLSRKVDGKTARQQTDREEDGCLQHFARSRPGEALSDVVEIGHYENGEDGRLGNDETCHRHFAAIRQSPGRGPSRKRSCDCAHCSLPSVIAAVRVFRMLQVPQGPAAGDHRNSGKVVLRWWGTY